MRSVGEIQNQESILFSEYIQSSFRRRLEFSLGSYRSLIGRLFARTAREVGFFFESEWERNEREY